MGLPGGIINEMKRGQTFFALVFLIGGLVLLIGLTLAFLANSFIDTGYGYQASVRAEAVAVSGVQDALLRLDRLPTSSVTGTSTVAVGTNTATVTVSSGVPAAGFATILSAATVSGRTRKINVVVTVNASTSQVSVVSWQTIQ